MANMSPHRYPLCDRFDKVGFSGTGMFEGLCKGKHDVSMWPDSSSDLLTECQI